LVTHLFKASYSKKQQ
jgi:hypothetical protein